MVSIGTKVLKGNERFYCKSSSAVAVCRTLNITWEHPIIKTLHIAEKANEVTSFGQKLFAKDVR